MSTPRIIAGKARGIHIKSVPGDTTRPITDRVKEALFNIIGVDIENAVFLDLFGGTGSVGIEALSRGAAHVCFVDINRQAVETIRSNLKLTRLEASAQVIQGDSLKLLESLPTRKYDYLYIAPPQYKGMWKDALSRADANPNLLAPDGWIIVQIHPIEWEEVSPMHFELFDQRRYGSTLLAFFVKKPDLP